MKYVNVDYIIEKVIAELPPNMTFDKSNIVEWIWECVALIAGSGMFIRKEMYLPVMFYKCELPNYCIDITTVKYMCDNPDKLYDDVYLNTILGDYIGQTNESFIVDKFQSNQIPKKYFIQDNHIFTSFEKGILKIEFSSYPVDENNKPLIPDEVNYIYAVVWFIVHKLLWRRFITQPDKANDALRMYARTEQDNYMNRAKCVTLIPDEDTMYNISDNRRIIQANRWRNPRWKQV